MYADADLLFFDEDSDNVAFSCNKMGILSVNLHNINLEKILMKVILILLFLSDLWLGIVNLKNTKHIKKDRCGINANIMPS